MICFSACMKMKISEKPVPAKKPFIEALSGVKTDRIPFWFMRQAGRYLPEYRELRAKAGGFLDLVFTPELATEVTVQPVRRYGMDAAILFSDILVIPHALGQSVRFLEGEGPVLGPVDTVSSQVEKHILSPVYETVSGVRKILDRDGFSKTALIGFAGAPWTVVCYMVEGGASRDFSKTLRMAQDDRRKFSALIDIVTEATSRYLDGQIAAGAEAIQIFDSWAGLAEDEMFEEFVIAPTLALTTRIKKNHPHVPIIGFPRNAGEKIHAYIGKTGVDAIAIDQSVSLETAVSLQKKMPVQGNMDPEILLRGCRDMRREAEKIFEALSGGPFIFNLGHGIMKETPPEHVAELSGIVKGWRR